jgi:hypothetical protein
MPADILEIVSNIIYNTPRPRPVDPAILADLNKIHKLVDEATNLAVRAASEMAAPTLTSLNGDSSSDYHPLNPLGFGGPPHGAKLSRERKFRIREQACQKLARAYRLNEILCSVATMQGATALDHIGEMVLQRNRGDPDAQYVHFFHEKIPSRQVSEYTSLEPLNEILMHHPGDAAALRTRATVRIFKNDLGGAIQDLTHALSICRMHEPSHALSKQIMTPASTEQYRKRYTDRALLEKDQQQTGLESQLLFQRASVYLSEACNHVAKCFPATAEKNGHTGQPSAAITSGGEEGEDAAADQGTQDDSSRGTSRSQVEARKIVKTLARRALRDYMTFLSHCDYSPDLPWTFIREFNEHINQAVRASKAGRSFESVKPMSALEPYTVYPMSDLFAAVAPPDLPPFPPPDLAEGADDAHLFPSRCEWATFHPMLTDALHSLLLCHCLVQTSVKELQRHANMVARLVRLCDGYPIFQGSRSPARSDWNEILNRAQDWVELSADWDTLCASPPFPGTSVDPYAAAQNSKPNPVVAASAAAALLSGRPDTLDATREEMEQQAARERAHEQAIVEALGDERVTDIQSFRAAVRSRANRDNEVIEISVTELDATNKVLREGTAPFPGSANPPSSSSAPPAATAPVLSLVEQQQPQTLKPAQGTHQYLEGWYQKWASEDSKDYPIMTERAAAIAHWIRDAPLVTGIAKKKKRTKKSTAVASAKADGEAGSAEQVEATEA